MQIPVISVLVLNFNGGKNLLAAVKSIYRSKLTVPFEVIVIDNGSTDKSIEALKKAVPRTKIVKLKRNTGTAAFTLVQDQAKGKYIFFTSDDKLLELFCLQRLYDVLKNNLKIAQACPLLLDAETKKVDVGGTWITPWFYAGKSTEMPKQPITKIPYMGMGLITVDALNNAGHNLYDPSYFFYGEDVDLGLRLKKADFEVVLVQNAIAHHLGDVSAGIWPRDYLIFLSERNSLRNYFKHSGIFKLILLMPLVVGMRVAKILLAFIRGNFKIAVARTRGVITAYREWILSLFGVS